MPKEVDPKSSVRGESVVPSSKKESHTNGERKKLVLKWRDASEEVIDYNEGEVKDKNGNLLYRYDKGHRLLIGEKQVMDSCEKPWAFATVDRAFREFQQNPNTSKPLKPLRVLERGFGMGITARRVIHNLITRGGEYVVIELNRKNAEFARKWKKDQTSGLVRMSRDLENTKPEISITILEGDAYEVTAELAEKGEKFDIIISDTFPLSEEEHGVNDLKDLETLKYCLASDGVFTFFAYFPGSTGGIVKKQENMITKNFETYNLDTVEVSPPPEYIYLQSESGPVRRLPVIVCKNPILA